MQVKSWFTVLLLAASAAAQELPANPALQQAIAVDDLEHDPARAKPLYAAIAADASAADAVRRHAALRLARVLRRLGEDASAALAQAEQGDDAVAKAAKLLRAELAEDPARQAELQKRAEAAVVAWVKGNDTEYTDVAWFGEAAVHAAVRGLPTWPDRRERSRAVLLLWVIGGEAARGYVRTALGADDAEARRTLGMVLPPPSGFVVGSDAALLHLAGASRIDLELVRLVLKDRDEDLVGGCLEVAMQANWPLTRADLLPLLHDPRDRVRRAARLCLMIAMRRFEGSPERVLPAGSPELRVALQRRGGSQDQWAAILAAESEAIAAELPKLLAATDPAEYRAACSLLFEWGPRSVAGRRLLVSVLPQLRLAGLNRARLPLSPGEGQRLLADENVESLGAALRQLGAWRASPEQRVVLELLHSSLHVWGRKALESVLLAIRLGYPSSEPGFWSHWEWLAKHATAADIPLVLSRLDTAESIVVVAPWLAQHDLPAAAFEPLRAAAQGQPKGGVLDALARTDHAGVVPLLCDFARAPNDPHNLARSLDLLMQHARVRPDVATRDALRAQLAAIWDRRATSDSTIITAHYTVAALVRLGDPTWFDKPATELSTLFTVNGQQRGFDLAGVPAPPAWPANSRIDSLYELVGASRVVDGRVRWWHGYSPDLISAFWRRAIDKDASDEVWRGVLRAVGGLTASKDAERAPLLAILMRLGEVVAHAVVNPRSGREAEPPLCNLLASVWRARRADQFAPVEAAAVDALHAAALAASAPELRALAVAFLQSGREADRAAIERAFADDDARVGVAALKLFAGQALPRDLLTRALRSPAQETRRQAVALLRDRTDDVADLWRGLLADTDAEIRVAACQTLAKSLRLDAVPPLLEALKDGDQRVREAATASLQAIRFYHDEQSHWQRVFDGRAGLTAASAAEALLAQAKPGNDKDTRLLAIRSLGALGAAETQSFLIGWTKDPDAEIAAAAREAVGRIHTKK